MSSNVISVVGVGEDGYGGLSSAAKAILKTAEMLIGGQRQMALLPDQAVPAECERRMWPSPLAEFLEELPQLRDKRIVVLATGDPMWFGIGATLCRRIPVQDLLIVPSQSAFSLAAARMRWPLEEVSQISLHGRPLENLATELFPGGRLLILTRDAKSPAEIGTFLSTRGFGESEMTVLAHMGGPNEARFEGRARDFNHNVPDFHTLCVHLSDSPEADWQPRMAGLDDACFRHDGKVTKREVRAVALAKLRPRPGALLWDIGCGSASISVEWMRSARRAAAVGIEPRPDRRAMAVHNAINLGVPDLELIDGSAPDSLAGLEYPDAVFIGGGLSRETAVVAMEALKPGGRLVAHAVTLESEAILLDLFSDHQGDLTRIAVSRAEPVGPFHGWRPAMPVTQWAWEKQ